MKHLFIFTSVILLVLNVASYEWLPFGPTERINDYEATEAGDMFGVNDGLWLGWDELEHFSYGSMPVTEIFQSYLSTDSVFVLLEDGSWSDGIYAFDLNDHTFSELDFLYQPNFIEQAENYLYVGYEYGLKRSENGIDWEEVPFFDGMKCGAMASFGENYTVSKTDMPTALYISDDFGENWNQSSFVVTNLPLTDFAYTNHPELSLFGVFPGYSNSSGLWQSADFGDHWNVFSYSNEMECVYATGNYLFTGWYENNQGVAMVDIEASELHFMNEGLENTQVVNFACNDMVDCINLVACTENGAYSCYDFSNVSISQTSISSPDITMMNYPNPFNPETTFSFRLSTDQEYSFYIYNVKGQRVFEQKGFSKKNEQQKISWNAASVQSGVYLYQLQADPVSKTGKCLLLK